MAEAVAVLGVVASIVQLADFSTKVISRLNEFNSVTKEVPESFVGVKTELPLLLSTLEQLKGALDATSVADGCKKALVPVIAGCNEQIAQLDGILKKIAPEAKDNWKIKGKKAMMSLHHDAKVESITKTLRNYIGTLSFYYIAASSTFQSLTDAKLCKIRQWLSAPDPSTNYNKAIKLRQAETGLWFVTSDAYNRWKTTAMSPLWLYGIPGCGKTILSSTIIQELLQQYQNDPGKVIAYFFFDFNDAQKQEPEMMVRSLLCQLSQQSVKISPGLDALFSSSEDGQRQPSMHALMEAFHLVIRELPQVYIVLDALDECGQRIELMEILETMARWKCLHILMTSRRERDIDSSLGTFVDEKSKISLQSTLVDEDIQQYIRKRLSDDKRLQKWGKDASMMEQIETTLMSGAKGMFVYPIRNAQAFHANDDARFRWAVCQLNELGKCLNRKMLQNALATLPPTLDQTYDRILAAIDKDYAEYAHRIFQWLSFSSRPLYLDEVAEIIAIDVNRDPAFNHDEVLEDPLEVLSICSSLVTIVPGADNDREGSREVVTLAHYSVKEYLVSDRIWTGKAAKYGLRSEACHDAIATGCLSYLLQLQQSELDRDIFQLFKLARYSAEFWSWHAQKSGEQTGGKHVSLALRLFSKENSAYINWIRLWDPDRPWEEPELRKDPKRISNPLYYAAFLSLREIVKILLDQGAEVNAQGGRLGKALHAASWDGNETIVKLLIDKGAEVNAGDHVIGNALQLAAVAGRNLVVELLLDAGADINTSYDKYGNALFAAVQAGHEDTVKLLLRRGADATVTDSRRRGVIHHALINSHCKRSLIALLFDHGAPLDTVDIYNMTPIHYCVNFGHTAIAKLLLDKGVQVDSKVHRKRWKMCISGGEEANQTESGSNYTTMSVQGLGGLTPLHFATLTGRSKMTEFLLEHGADPNALSDYGETPLHLTLRTTLHGTEYKDAWNTPFLETQGLWNLTGFEENRIAVLNSLLSQTRINMSMKDHKGDYPIHCVKYNESDSRKVIHKLVARKADPLSVNAENQSALHLASRAGDHKSVELLLSLGADGTSIDSEGLNALHYAAQGKDLKTILAILDSEKAKEVSLTTSKDKQGKNALHHLLSDGDFHQIEPVQLLLNRGVDGSALSGSGISPLASYFRGTKLFLNIGICRLLLASEGSASFVKEDGQTLGHLCASTLGFGLDILEVLQEYGVDLARKDLQERTVLHHSAISSSLTRISLRFLVDIIGLDPGAKDKSGTTALQYATKTSAETDDEIVRYDVRWQITKDVLIEECSAQVAQSSSAE
ncbi:hypothetical protein SLS60_007141 [Paraconiothyrium brasiliense]|uniref:Ankyrin repeat protein n=1 Tax=Paraconiothyrium brasiliense TaxID=300254 RepID=A0ABR3R901_9PLEO